MNQPKIDELPEHIKGITFKPWHFYLPNKSKKLVVSDNFIDEVMREKNIKFTPDITHILDYGPSKFILVAKVTVWSTSESTIAFASITRSPKEGGQTHFAQIAVTRALKTAVLRHLQISDHDLELAIEAYGITLDTIKSQARNISEDEPDDTDDEAETIQDAPTMSAEELGLNFK